MSSQWCYLKIDTNGFVSICECFKQKALQMSVSLILIRPSQL